MIKGHFLESAVTSVVATLLLVVQPAQCQSHETGSSAPQNSSLPSAPRPTIPCSENDSNCPDWAGNLVKPGPTSPEGKSHAVRDRDLVHFYTYRSSEDPPLRNNRDVFRSKLFVSTHLGGLIAMLVACHSGKPGQSCGSGAIAVGTLFGMDYLQFRFVGGPNAIGAPIYEMIHYGRASVR